MAEAAGRRNILRDFCTLVERGVGSSFYNSNLPPTPTSPEQNIIENRGLQKKPATYKYDAPDPVFFKTPTKSPKKASVFQRLSSPVKTPVRSSPRKRLNMTPESIVLNEEGFAELTIAPKRVKREPLKNVKPSNNFEKSLKALSQSQLVELISDAMKSTPELSETLVKLVPEPDLTPVDARLSVLQRTVNKSLPRNVWGSQDSSFTFLRVRSHLEAYKKECLEYCDQFLESEHWPTFFEFVFIAWKYTLLLPQWSTVIHNRAKNVCLKQISTKCIKALNEANLDYEALAELINRMKPYEEEATVKNCISAAKSLIDKKFYHL
ncbi:uncharacterized protein [Parasteatoda tepidariorum]|uniref:uncharacterized protein n=1 Tax=Parasteatoda tepidariorum TaxID=114398 RepID=UPI00077FC198|nr:uncharacterized protein LOC107455085 [Parasteatoda tepidariorum]XP_015928003.1 uncharacterized protein LOC107455085 [Parasteatoda tepidariorum]XP_015928004.1 uncharacterized protein LOC107455085 [Parasteatoda tepidariorum]XP_042912186.1 uncharacterized protein LOC107455085 [Parasteatoda tepidariorum]XP_042912193.1 uncharacterized protein LOC107455085 [Parasteatoda tepidariorum]